MSLAVTFKLCRKIIDSVVTVFVCFIIKYMQLKRCGRTFNFFRAMHYKCRNNYYPGNENVKRVTVPDDKVEWTIEWEDYKPVVCNNPCILDKFWADPPLTAHFKPKWNSLDGPVNRISYSGVYTIVKDIPINLRGRTGIEGRGLLGRWGPNHAADPIVTRWSRNENGEIMKHFKSNAPLLQFVAIQRRDCKEWAIPGGMVDPGEKISNTLQREFMEEALNSLEQEGKDAEHLIQEFFSQGVEVYRGYVDDPRNTDNAWMETVAYNFHDGDEQTVGRFRLEAGDDAQNVRWLTISSDLRIYASHAEFLQKVASLHHAHW